MNKPLKKDYCKPFSMDNSLVLFDSKGYANNAEKYIEFLESEIRNFCNSAIIEKKIATNQLSYFKGRFNKILNNK